MVTKVLKETALADIHRKAGARMVDFAGWNMPVQYKSIITEHMAVRTRVGLFDVSHMGEFRITGESSREFIQHVIPNDLNKLHSPNTALYTQILNEHGGTIDDLILYCREQDFLMVVNASNIDKDWAWLVKQSGNFKDVTLTDLSDTIALFALQGPKASELLASLAGDFVRSMPSFTYGEATVDGTEISFGRTGYTGEDGFEIFVPTADAIKIWTLIMEKGADAGIEACGLGARDTLRLEAGLPLYGHELDEDTSPLAAGLGWSVKLDKGKFIGHDSLVNEKANGFKKQLVGLKVEGKALPRQGYDILAAESNVEGSKVGTVTSGSQGIFVGYPIAFAYVDPKYAKVGQNLSVRIRDTEVPAQVIKRPFYKR